VHVDLRRDFAHAFTIPSGGGTFALPGADAQSNLTDQFVDRLGALDRAIVGFEELLASQPSGAEEIFQTFLEENPVLLDVYGCIEARPRFRYPDGESPLGKQYVEPDFVVRYPGQQYRLIELERPGKQLGTKKGHAAVDLTQAAFQIGEWKTYIAKHYELLREKYPGISTAYRTTIVISRATELQLGGKREAQSMLELYTQQLGTDEVLLYDDLIRRAREAYDRLSAHAMGGGVTAA
jgi:hypothetical protein